MANNRLYIIHKPTGEAFLLAKTLGVGWYMPPYWNNSASYGDALMEFLEKFPDPASIGMGSDETDFKLDTER